MKLSRRLSCVLAVCVGCGEVANGIIIRHDRDDVKSLELAKHYSGIVRVGSDTGTVIDADWVLTAAHVVDALSPFSRGVRVGDEWHRISAVKVHPSWTGEVTSKTTDLALVRVTPPIHDPHVAIPYRWNDEKGKTVTIVGAGASGNGLDGRTRDEGLMRAATNVIDDIRPNWLIFTFDAPPAGTDLEGVSGPGDSGGPAFVERDGKRYIAGVSSTNHTGDAAGPCRYKSREYYARVSTSLDWITSTIHAPVSTESAAPEATPYSAAALPQSSAGRVVKAFFNNFAAGSEAAMQRFEERFRCPSALAEMSASARASRWVNWKKEKWPSLQPRKFVPISAHDIAVLVHVPEKGSWHSFRFVMDDEHPDKLAGIYIEAAAPPAK